MALFKISKGSKNNLPTELTEGYCWYTYDDSKFYIDFKDENGVLTRKALNAQDAETLGLHTADEFILEADKQKLINEVLDQIPDSGITDEEKQEIVDDVIDQVQNPIIESVGEKSLVGNETNLNMASGKWSVALNYNNTASGNNAVATGTTTTASGAAALSANCGTEATGDISTAFGNYAKATTTYAFASGDHTEANGVASFAANHNNKANGQNSFATGSTNTITAEGKNGFVAGASNTVSGETSSAFGLLNEVSGKYSNAFGQQNVVTGNYSNAQGYNQKNRGHFASTFGHSTETYEGSYNQSAFGTYNKASSDSLFMIGVGTSDTNRKNALEVKSDGTVMIGNAPLTEEKIKSIGDSTGGLVVSGSGSNSTISNDHVHNRAVGEYSHSEGYATAAHGNKSHAEGDNTKAEGVASHAEGFGTQALGEYQHTQGKWNVVDKSNKYAHIVGNGEPGTPSNAHTLDWDGLGWFKKGIKVGGTSQDDSAAVSVLTTKDTQSIVDEVLEQIPESSGNSLVVAGAGANSTISNDLVNNKASSPYSHAEGRNTTASGNCSHAEGDGTTASGRASHSEGYDTTASGDYGSHAEGYESKAIGTTSHAEGEGTEAHGENSHTEGKLTKTTASWAHAEGFKTEANGEASHAEGKYAFAHGEASHAGGEYTVAYGKSQHVQGEYNIPDESTNKWTRAKYVHIVGNGTSETDRSNAHTLDWNGVGWFAGGLKIGGTGQTDENAVDLLTYIQSLESRIAALEGN